MNPIEVFFCSSPRSMGRYKLAQQMLEIWKQANADGLVKLIAYSCPPESSFGFQSKRRQLADSEAKGAIYILTDDDMEPSDDLRKMLELWLGYGTSTLEHQPAFAILSASPDNATINRWTPENYQAFEDVNVMEHVNVGGLRFCRKGCLTAWPEQTKRSYDQEHCEALRANGWRVGYFKHLHAIHHGEGFSDLWHNETQEASSLIQ